MITVKPHIAQISAYAPPWPGLDRSQYLCLDQNENTQPLPAVAVEAIVRYLERVGVHAYPEYDRFYEKLATYCGAPAECLLVTNGSDRAIDVVLRAFLAPGDGLLVARPEFAMFGLTANLLGARVLGVPYEPGFRYPYETFLRAVSREVKLIVAINPNNPTGTPITTDYLEHLVRSYPEIPILVDEAYYEYTGCTVIDLVRQHPNVIILRTFSKAFAMAGLRLGYVVARPELIREFHKLRGPFDVNSLALQAAATQIDHPEARLAHVAEIMTRSKPLVEQFLRSRGIVFHPGAANFILVEHPRRDELVAFLKSQGILVRPLRGPLLDGLIRMNLGTLSEMNRLVETLTRFEEVPHHAG
jgi:histidinol-phosphate aminotransferase